MAWKEEHTHIHIHNDNKEVVCLLKEIRDILKKGNEGDDDGALIQQVMDKLEKTIVDIKSTV